MSRDRKDPLKKRLKYGRLPRQERKNTKSAKAKRSKVCPRVMYIRSCAYAVFVSREEGPFLSFPSNKSSPFLSFHPMSVAGLLLSYTHAGKGGKGPEREATTTTTSIVLLIIWSCVCVCSRKCDLSSFSFSLLHASLFM